MTKMGIGKFRGRRLIVVIMALLGVTGLVVANPESYEEVPDSAAQGEASTNADPIAENDNSSNVDSVSPRAADILEKLEIKGRAPKTGYTREEFYKTWPTIEGCSLRQRIIRRELGDAATLADDQCTVIAGSFVEPYTGKTLTFTEKTEFSTGIQIDHVVALSDAWQKGAQNISAEERYALATDPLNLLAVDSSANQQKSDGDAATWLPANKQFRCQYVARQVSVKYKYHLWVTQAEHDMISKVLEVCPDERAVGVE